MESKNEKESKTDLNKGPQGIKIIENSRIKAIKFPDASLIEKHDKVELDLDWKIPECLVIKYSNNDSHLAAGYTDGHIIIYDLLTPDDPEKNLIKIMSYSGSSISSLRWKPKQNNQSKNILLSVSSDGNIIYWHSSTGKLIHRINEVKNHLLALDYSPDGTSFAIGGDDNMLKIYDENMKMLTIKFAPGSGSRLGHESRIYSVCYNKDSSFNNMMITGGWDRNVLLYDLRTKNITGRITGPYICGDSLDLNGYNILVGSHSYTNQMQIWDTRTLKLVSSIFWDEDNESFNTNIYSAKFSPDNKSFGIGCSSANYVRVYEAENENKPLVLTRALDKPVYSIDFSNNGKSIAFAGADNHISVFKI